MALFEWVAAMEIVCKDSVGGDTVHHRYNELSQTDGHFMRERGTIIV